MPLLPVSGWLSLVGWLAIISSNSGRYQYLYPQIFVSSNTGGYQPVLRISHRKPCSFLKPQNIENLVQSCCKWLLLVWLCLFSGVCWVFGHFLCHIQKKSFFVGIDYTILTIMDHIWNYIIIIHMGQSHSRKMIIFIFLYFFLLLFMFSAEKLTFISRSELDNLNFYIRSKTFYNRDQLELFSTTKNGSK